jgi:hypothetical protein
VSPTGDSVGLYFPTGHSVSDALNYDSAEAGALGELINRMENSGQKVTTGDVLGAATAAGRNRLRGLADTAGAQEAFNRINRSVRNPQEFMLFNSPGIREFSFSFSFLPQSETEAQTVPRIIQFFRKSAYPVEQDLDYRFPDTFSIAFQQSSDDVIRMPEVACTGINVSYNPNSMSYFRNGNQPVETELELSFTELRPISRGLVEQGF